MPLWDIAFETGNELVDTDHKEIFELVEQLLTSSVTSPKEKVKTAIEFLANYVVRHFANEERLMDESDYPRSVLHKKEHSDFLVVATGLHEKFTNDGYTLGESENDDLHLSKDIKKTVVGWLTNHVMGSDRDLADHYRQWVEKNQ
ncbi:MAG: hemerythrin family protein [Defluviitaleaceae bacterium]|nr:hemerythrin family protein [Defluviitaleaceae bacterium]